MTNANEHLSTASIGTHRGVAIGLRDASLLYGEFLLRRMKIAGTTGRWAIVEDSCARFERLMANLPPVPQPLVWAGDYA